ncbi:MULTISPECIES: GGDEF domain-containing protein [unclassified Arsukibacterium]|uniref:GGDEF domain-containing protein n=1 Tax=unclassified Arsukibacterium TaxID=2635278 RepID=UPI000C3529B3|nr:MULTISPECIES: GGDEF domain-containing protein [unclassified Arsukibacterium]MAA94538.1 hypothetical protein [Rheinheimera sp.]MBM32880.1 hypothetical protein [Rheinheimera sp.]HAW94549.1 hypothetical protein [Candidatus Azambacteria bacterium]|tara:strand:- start:151 stop:876 length:726 start_codon:yes stop_codon:yes gene_type:complete
MLEEPEHVESQLLRNVVLQINYNAQHAELVQLRCEFLLQRNSWDKQQHKLQHANQQLSQALQQAGILNTHTQVQLHQAKLNNQYDALTLTLNRSAMLDRIGYAFSMAKRQQSQFALLFIDLNNFKPVNDQYGHEAGDKVLQQVSARLKAAVRDSDAVSRHGGDEFLLLLTDIKSDEDISAFADKLQHILAEPYQLGNRSVWLSASIGISVFPRDAATVSELIGCADAAMYRDKQHSKRRIG